MLIDRVRAATYALHQSLDNLMIPNIEAIRSKEDYAALLLQLYGFFKPVYDNTDRFLDTNYLPDYRSRRKPEWILNDLKDLEVNHTIHLCEHLPHIDSNAAACGALYVLEGSTMGGMIIKKMIHEKLHSDDGLTFFSGYGKQTRERWNVFIHYLNDIDNHKEASEMVIQTAAATFMFFKEWLQRSKPAAITFLHRSTPADY